MTSTVSFLEVSIPEKYWVLKLWLTPIYILNCPTGYLPKSISMAKMNEVVGIYLAEIDLAPLNPLTISVVKTLLQLSLQSFAEARRAFGR